MKLNINRRKAVSPVIATLLLIAIAVAAAIIVYAFVTGLIGGLTSGSPGIVTISPTLTVPTGSGTGTLILTLDNKGGTPITAATVTIDPADVGVTITQAAIVYGQGQAAGPTFTGYTGSLGTGQSASIVGNGDGFTAGETYSFTVTYTTTNGASSQSVSVVAQP